MDSTPLSLYSCLATWPTDPTAGDLMASYIRPQHTCKLDADHVHRSRGVQLLLADGSVTDQPQHHECHCGAWLPVRDVEVPA